MRTTTPLVPSSNPSGIRSGRIPVLAGADDEAGENPRFIFRRMLIAAGEDIGLADPQAIVVVEACAATFERVGLPEGLYPLAQAALPGQHCVPTALWASSMP